MTGSTLQLIKTLIIHIISERKVDRDSKNINSFNRLKDSLLIIVRFTSIIQTIIMEHHSQKTAISVFENLLSDLLREIGLIFKGFTADHRILASKDKSIVESLYENVSSWLFLDAEQLKTSLQLINTLYFGEKVVYKVHLREAIVHFIGQYWDLADDGYQSRLQELKLLNTFRVRLAHLTNQEEVGDFYREGRVLMHKRDILNTLFNLFKSRKVLKLRHLRNETVGAMRTVIIQYVRFLYYSPFLIKDIG